MTTPLRRAQQRRQNRIEEIIATATAKGIAQDQEARGITPPTKRFSKKGLARPCSDRCQNAYGRDHRGCVQAHN